MKHYVDLTSHQQTPPVIKSRATHYTQVKTSSKSYNWYTPAWIIEKVKHVMGHIDLDPASDEYGNQIVQAKTYYSENGLQQPWYDNVWLNPPSMRGVETVAPWCYHLLDCYQLGKVKEACLLIFNAGTETQHFQKFMGYHPILFFNKRIKYGNGLDPSATTSPLTGSALIYLGDNKVKFFDTFKTYGKIWLP